MWLDLVFVWCTLQWYHVVWCIVLCCCTLPSKYFLSVRLSVCVSVWLSFCLSVLLSVYLFVCLSVCLSASLTFFLSFLILFHLIQITPSSNSTSFFLLSLSTIKTHSAWCDQAHCTVHCTCKPIRYAGTYSRIYNTYYSWDTILWLLR